MKKNKPATKMLFASLLLLVIVLGAYRLNWQKTLQNRENSLSKSHNSTSNQEILPQPAAPGTYLATSVADQEGHDLSDDLRYLESLGLTQALTLHEDGTGEINLDGRTLSLIWDDFTMTITSDDDEGIPENERVAIPYSFDGKNLTLQRLEGEIVFTQQ